MNSFECDLLLSSPPPKVYKALTTQYGIQSWWTKSCEVGTAVGEQITIRFGHTFKVMRIEALSLDTEVRWNVIDAHLVVPGLIRTTEWIGSTIAFQLMPQPNGITRLHLEHIGLTPEVECYEICSQGWRQFLGSLKSYVETGKGFPYVESEA